MCVCVCLFLLHYSAPAVGGLCFWFIFPCSFDSTVHCIVVSWVCVCVDMLLCACAHVWVSPQPLRPNAHSALFCKKIKKQLSYVTWVSSRKLFLLTKSFGSYFLHILRSKLVKLCWSLPCSHSQSCLALNFHVAQHTVWSIIFHITWLRYFEILI